MNMEKVETGFELCANGEPCMGEKFLKCPFSPRNNAEQNCGVIMARNALELLKEQQEQIDRLIEENASNAEMAEGLKELLKKQEATTFKPHYIDKYSKHFICGVECGSCHKEISSTYHYCPYCGKEVKWE